MISADTISQDIRCYLMRPASPPGVGGLGMLEGVHQPQRRVLGWTRALGGPGVQLVQ